MKSSEKFLYQSSILYDQYSLQWLYYSGDKLVLICNEDVDEENIVEETQQLFTYDQTYNESIGVQYLEDFEKTQQNLMKTQKMNTNINSYCYSSPSSEEQRMASNFSQDYHAQFTSNHPTKKGRQCKDQFYYIDIILVKRPQSTIRSNNNEQNQLSQTRKISKNRKIFNIQNQQLNNNDSAFQQTTSIDLNPNSSAAAFLKKYSVQSKNNLGESKQSIVPTLKKFIPVLQNQRFSITESRIKGGRLTQSQFNSPKRDLLGSGKRETLQRVARYNLSQTEEMIYHNFVSLISQFDRSKIYSRFNNIQLGIMDDIAQDTIKDALDNREGILMVNSITQSQLDRY